MVTPLQGTFNAVSGNAMSAFTIIGVVAAIIGFFILIFTGSGFIRALVISVLLVFGMRWVGSTRAQAQGEFAITTAWEQAKTDQATFIETLHAPFVAYGEDITTCKRTKNFRPDCQYFSSKEVGNGHYICDSKDDDGNCTSQHEDTDTIYTPWFKYERSPWAAADVLPRLAESPLQMVDGYPLPRQYFADRLAPEDKEAFEWGSIPFYGSYEFESPAEWLRIKNAIDNGGPIVVGNFPHHYLNFFHADDQTLFTEYDGNISTYKGLNVLPTMNQIYGRYDYNFVQFADGVSPANVNQWQETARVWAANAGPKLQASLILFFVPESKITNRLEFISTSKAYLMQKSSFGLRILPKNLVLVGCAVSNNTTVKWCEMETGMYTGNHLVEEDVAKVTDLPFTPDAMFGALSANSYGPADASGIHATNIAFGSNGVLSLLYRPAPDGFSRVKMGPNDYLMTNVKPTQAQIDAIIGGENSNSILFAFLFGFVAVGLAFGIGYVSQPSR